MNWNFLRLNNVILVTILADFMFTTANAVIAPVFALFVVDDITGASVSTIGFAVAAFWIVKSILQLPIARYLDKNHGELDDYYAVLFGLFLMVIAFSAYYFATAVWHVYALQILNAVGHAFFVPPFLAIFTRHLDRDSEGFEWALHSSFSIGAASALGGVFSGVLVATIGIRPLFLINAGLTLLTLIILIFLRPYILPRVSTKVDRMAIPRR